VTVELGQYATSAARQMALRQLQAAGFGWVRQRMDWADVEPSPGEFHWADSDVILADVAAVGLIPVVVLDGSPAWARAPDDIDNPLAPAAQDAAFARFAAAFAARYGNLVRFYQIWDEPNIAPHWGNRLVEPLGYARLLKATAPAVRDADADAVILLAALAPTGDRGHTAIDEVYYLQRLYAAGAAPFFDAVAAQPFGFGAPPDDPRSRTDILNFGRVRLIRRTMVAAGDGETPIWAIRFGWNRTANNIWRTVTPETQIRYAQEAVALAAGWPWLVTMGWAIDRPAAPPNDPLWGFALFDPDGEPTPLLATLAQPKNGEPSSASSLPSASLLLGLFILGLLLIGWRSQMALCLLPLTEWLERYRSSPLIVRVGVWALLLLVYYFVTWPPLIGLCWIAAAILILAHPLVGLSLVAFFLPFHFHHKEIDLIAFVVVVPPAQAALICTLPTFAHRIVPLARVYFCVPLHLRASRADSLAVAWLGISLLAATNVWHWPGYMAGLWSLVVVPLLIYCAGRTLVDTIGAWRMVVMALALGGVTSAFIGVLLWIDGGGVSVDGTRRLLGVTFSPNQTALYLLRSFFVLIGIAIAGQRRWRWRGGAAVVVLALLLTASRGALLLGIPAGVVTLLWMSNLERWRWRYILWGGALLAGVVLVAGLWGERLQNSETVLRRFAIWQGALDLWHAYPLSGVGPGGFFWQYPAFIVPEAMDEPNLSHAHNIWLNFATGWGGMGVLWLLGLLIWLGHRCRLVRDDGDWTRIGLVAALAAALLHAHVDAFAVLPELAAWNWMAIALLVQKTKQKSNGLPV
jgi:O-antigen ligase